jgi:hypothetical protein
MSKLPRPLRGLNDYLDALDRAEPPVPAAARILAALGPRKLELAAGRAAGAIPLSAVTGPASPAWGSPPPISTRSATTWWTSS